MKNMFYYEISKKMFYYEISKNKDEFSVVTPASMLDGPLLEKESRPLPPPVANKRSEKGECEWNNIMLPQAPPRFPPFVALDEEERKVRARQNKQGEIYFYIHANIC